MRSRPVQLTRRQLLKLGAAAGAGLLLGRGARARRAFAAIPGGSLDPTTITKYAMPLVIPPAMPQTGDRHGRVDHYEIAVRQFRQQILPTGMPRTTVWGYGSIHHQGSFHSPAYTIEARFGRPVSVTWVNGLTDQDGHYLPHLFPIDPTLHWANPPGGHDGRDMRSTFSATPGPYTGPVPIVTHLHGGHNAQESDGFPEAWYLPAAANIPAGFAADGTWYAPFRTEFAEKFGVIWEPGTATFRYENDQRAATLWYHDHALGMTRANVYTGLAGFYLLRRGAGDLPSTVLPGPAPGVGADPLGRFFEIPIAIQDRSFNADGSLFYPRGRDFFDGFTGPYVPGSDVPPLWNPEFFGNVMVVNGRTWPYLEVEPRRYRFRLLNGSNSRFLILKLVGDPLAPRPATAALAVWQIGGDGGFLAAPAMLDQFLLAPAERADVIVDFTGLRAGTELYLINEGPDEPFGGGVANTDFAAADPLTTGQVMKFRVVALAGRDKSIPPERLRLPAPAALGHPSHTRQLSLNEQASSIFDGPVAAMLGTLAAGGTPVPLAWGDEITENPVRGATEMWEIHNFTEDAHPIHFHQVQFEIVDRQPLDGAPRPPEVGETGRKDTVIALPAEITRVKARFDLPGLYVWHCHILEHEDNEMMRPYVVETSRHRAHHHERHVRLRGAHPRNG